MNELQALIREIIEGGLLPATTPFEQLLSRALAMLIDVAPLSPERYHAIASLSTYLDGVERAAWAQLRAGAMSLAAAEVDLTVALAGLKGDTAVPIGRPA